MPRNDLWPFVLRIFLWLPPSFAVWYVSAPWLSAALGQSADALLSLLYPGLVTGLERQGNVLAFVTSIKVHPTPGTTALLLPEVHALTYSYGLPLYIALALAARAKWWTLLAGALILLPFQVWGVVFDFLAQVGIRMGPEVASQAGIHGSKRELIALGYQLGSLIFPTLAPVLVWAGWNRAYLSQLMNLPPTAGGDESTGKPN